MVGVEAAAVFAASAEKKAKAYTDEKTSALMGGVRWKGYVNYYSDLPANPAEGDAYTVRYMGTSGTDPDRREFVWGKQQGASTYEWVEFGSADQGAVHYSADTGKSSAEKAQARANIGAQAETDNNFQTTAKTVVGAVNELKENKADKSQLIFPTITVTTSAGATVTATKETQTVTRTADQNGVAVVPVSDYGNWLVTASKDTKSDSTTITVDAVKKYSTTINLGDIYGVEWGRTASPVWTRTDDAALFTDPVPYVLGMSTGDYSSPFDNIMPWSGMTRITDSEAGELVKIPKFYYKWTNAGEKMKLQISSAQQIGFHTSPAHMDRGDGHGERDYVYIGRYHCSSTDYKSTSGVSPKVSITRATARNAISALGNTVWQMDHAMWWTIGMLYLVEFANANCQGTIGYGRGNGSGAQAMGYTDSMPYHTGTMLSSKTTYGVSTQYRNIEGLWDNCLDWCDGIYFNGSSIYHILNPANFSDSSGGTLTGTRATDTYKVITGLTFPTATGYEWAGYPGSGDIGASTTTGSDYFCDNEYYGSTGVVLCVGGSYDQNQGDGLFCRDGDNAASSAYARIGARLMKVP